MRTVLLSIAIAFLFQSCYTYKAFDATEDKLVSGQKYKIERSRKTNKFFYKRTTDSSLIVSRSRYGKEIQIPLKEVTTIRKRKFSALKTIALLPATAVVIAGLFALTYNGPAVSMSGINSPD